MSEIKFLHQVLESVQLYCVVSLEVKLNTYLMR